MADENEGLDTGAAEASGAGVDPFAAAMALGGASRETADAFLKNQNSLIDIQKHHVGEQSKYLHEQFKQLRMGIWEKRLGVLLRIATGFVGLAVAAGVAFMIWNASQSSGLLIEPFSVPPDLAQRGMTGEVVAAKLLDRLAAMQGQTSSQRAPATYANSWSQKDIKLDIPETGVSLSELDGFLREKLGNDTHISGEIVRTASGLNMTARAGVDGATSVQGSETDLDTLVQASGESIYGLTQPYRYAIYLTEHGRVAEAIPDFMAQARTGSAQERSWAYLGWALASLDNDGVDAQLGLLERSVAAGPDNSIAWIDISEAEDAKSLPEQALRDCRKILSLLSNGDQRAVRADLVPTVRIATQSQIDLQLGAFHNAAQEQADVVHSGLPGRFGVSARLAWAQTGEHDLAAARATVTNSLKDAGIAPGMEALYKSWARILIDNEAGDWTAVLSEAALVGPLAQKYRGVRSLLPMTTAPVMAYAQAKRGDIAAAEARIAGTPPDCYVCLRTHARIAELKGDHAGADGWFARAVQDAPSIPLAYSEWGQALLSRDNPDAAIVKFTLANQKGPHFADPIEMWGEALMAKNRSDLALAKFDEADKYAPNWGRLHLKWGEALGYAGKKDEAQKQFALAAGLDLSAADKVELARISAHG